LPRQARDEATPDRIGDSDHDYWRRLRHCPRREDCWGPSSNDDVYIQPSKVRRSISKQFWTFSESNFENDILTFNVAKISQTLPEGV
jgi:hypothetical protein